MVIGICDDEQYYRNAIKNQLIVILNKNGIEAELISFSNAQELLNSNVICELLFLDIEMEGENGLNAAMDYVKKNKRVLIVFITSHGEYSKQGYKVSAFRFIEKTDDVSCIEEAVLSAKIKLMKQKELNVAILNGGVACIKADDICYVEVSDRKTYIHTVDDILVSRTTITEITAILQNTCFYLVHRAFLVNYNYIKLVKKLEITMDNGMCIPLSEKRRKDFYHCFMAYMYERGNL
ncbi:MAG: LytTR family DNA-binding domain-containing protein [Hespellia sp.]|nr:LytTR family DNA-binding domain-containing protein [Hespellia sp.]